MVAERRLFVILKSMTYTTAIFDLDGVVIDSEPLWDLADAELLRRYGLIYKSEDIKSKIVGKNFNESTGIIKSTYNIPIDLNKLIDERRSLIEVFYRTKLEFVAGFEDLHNYLLNKNYRTCIATALSEHLVDIADARLGLRKIFSDKVYHVANVGNKSKPDPAIFLFAAQQLGSRPDECFVVEDAPHGVKGAKNAGMICVGYTGTFPKNMLSEADILVDSLLQIKDYF